MKKVNDPFPSPPKKRAPADPELRAMRRAVRAFARCTDGLSRDARARVLAYVASRAASLGDDATTTPA